MATSLQPHLFDSLKITNPIPQGDPCLQFDHSIGRAIKVMRIKRGISQQKLAKLLSRELIQEEVNQSYISKVEKGTLRGGTGLSLPRLSLFCKHLRCKPSLIIEMAEFLVQYKDLDDKKLFAHIKKTVEMRIRPDRRPSMV